MNEPLTFRDRAILAAITGLMSGLEFQQQLKRTSEEKDFAALVHNTAIDAIAIADAVDKLRTKAPPSQN